MLSCFHICRGIVGTLHCLNVVVVTAVEVSQSQSESFLSFVQKRFAH